MERYRIDLDGVQRVLASTSRVAQGFETDLEPLDGHVSAAAGACGDSGAIVPALKEFFAEQDKQLKAVDRQVAACLTGAAAAAKAYDDSDWEMVLTYQRNASRAEISEIPR